MKKMTLNANSLCILFFLILWAHAATLGLSDDEAYYWVLAQKPALGYAFHPPAVAWMIALFQFLFGGLVGTHSPGLVRLPAVLGTTLILFFSLKWLKEAGLPRSRSVRAGLVLLSFCGFFPLSWMMVPDIPLFLGWTLLFISTWSLCFKGEKRFRVDLTVLGGGAALSLLSKYSAVLALLSSLICLWVWAPRERRFKSMMALSLGAILAVIPIFIWNANHQWASLLYQIRDRHGDGSISWVRFLRFWAVEAICAGPISLYLGVKFLSKVIRGAIWKKDSCASPIYPFIAIWTLPAALVFCVQPLISDFKPHWAFVVWWPLFLYLAWVSQEEDWKWVRYQVRYGITFGVFVILCCHIPIGSWLVKQFSRTYDPKLDVTNDLVGWSQLPDFIGKNLGKENLGLPVVGSRYQTAAQAAFGMGEGSRVTFIPRDKKEWDEWDDFGIAEGRGPDWPKLRTSVLFVADIRYDSEPTFPQSVCIKLGRLEANRFELLAKWIDVWRCDPSALGSRNF